MEEGAHRQALPAGTRLQNHRVLGVLGIGGFGVTYLAEHVTLGQRAAIKEYLPNEFAVREGATVHPKSEADRGDFEWGLKRFLDEARTLARFEHPNVVRVRDHFEANGAACIVMDYEEGEPLDALLAHRGALAEAQLLRILLPVVDGLREVQAAGFLHRDVKPSNVFVRRSDEAPVEAPPWSRDETSGCARPCARSRLQTPDSAAPTPSRSNPSPASHWTQRPCPQHTLVESLSHLPAIGPRSNLSPSTPIRCPASGSSNPHGVRNQRPIRWLNQFAAPA